MTDVAAPSRSSERHPPGLWILAVTEVWERFSYYGMRALLVFYMTKQLGIGQASASQIYGAYTAAIWFVLLPGGAIADRWLGRRRATLYGAGLMVLGHFMMAFEPLFFPALAVIVLGNGLFKPNISTQVGFLYAPDDPRRDRGYGLFYVGINLGSMIAPLVCGTVGEVYGWHYGFALAGFGMLAGLAVYAAGGRWLPPETPPERAEADLRAEPAGLRRRLAILVLITLAATPFWACLEQSGNTVALWADAYTDRTVHLLGRDLLIPATWAQSINGFVIVLGMPVLAEVWRRQARAGREPGSLSKMVIGAGLAAAACVIMAAAAWRFDTTGQPVSWLWIVAFFVVITVGELYLSPTCLSLFNRVAPVRWASTLLGVWYLSLFAGSLAAGSFGALWDTLPKAVFFAILAGLALACAAALAVIGRAASRQLEPAAA